MVMKSRTPKTRPPLVRESVVAYEVSVDAGPGPNREIPAGEFKARCLALMDEVARTGGQYVITKRGYRSLGCSRRVSSVAHFSGA